MAAPINRTPVFHEIADSVMGIVTKEALVKFDKKVIREKTEIVSRTIAAAFSGGFLGMLLTPSGTISFVVTGVLAFSHFSCQDENQPFQGFSFFNELDKTSRNIVEAMTLFWETPEMRDQAILVAKVIAIAAAVGLIGSMIGLSSLSLFAASVPFALVRLTHFPDVVHELAPKEEPASQPDVIPPSLIEYQSQPTADAPPAEQAILENQQKIVETPKIPEEEDKFYDSVDVS